MPTWKEFLEQIAVIRAAPIPFLMALAFASGIIWFLMNFSYQGAISGKDATIQAKQSEVDLYKDKLNGASPEEAKTRIESLERRLAILEPRYISGNQRNIIDRILNMENDHDLSVTVLYDAECLDCRQYSSEIANVLKSAKWKVKFGYSLGAPSIDTQSSIIICVQDEANLPREALSLTKAFQEAGIVYDIVQRSVDETELRIYPKLMQ